LGDATNHAQTGRKRRHAHIINEVIEGISRGTALA
jgi:hypothetical protein